jgi:quinol monooxygenase YgiN
MLINCIQYTFAAKDSDVVESLFRELRDASRKEPGVIQFEVARGREKPNVFALWEVYRDQEAIDAHAASEHFQRFVIKGVRPLAQERIIAKVVPI